MSTLQVSNIVGPTTIDATTANATSLAVTGGASIYRKTNTGNVDNSLTLGTTNKSSSPSNFEGYIHIKSNDATNQLRGWMRLVTDSTQANRRLAIDAYEDNVAARNITLAESGGNVGIGTVNPDQKLVVNGIIQSGLTGNEGNFFLGGPNVSLRSNYSLNVLGIYTNNTEKIRIDSSGNVGIGTVNPQSKLHIQGNGTANPTFVSDDYFIFSATGGAGFNTAINIVSGTAGQSKLKFSSSTTNSLGAITYDMTNNFMSFNTNSSERMRITTGGLVGIGTTDPQVKLHIANGSIRLTSSSGNPTIQMGSTSGYALIYNLTNNRFQINYDAIIGIGLRTPFQLGVNNSTTGNTPLIYFDSDETLVSATWSKVKLGMYSTDTVTNGYGAWSNQTTMTNFISYFDHYNSAPLSSDAFGTWDRDGVAARINGVGNFQSRNSSYGGISDIKLKENIVDTAPKLADLMKVKVRNYNFKTNKNSKQLGVIAQELEVVFPGLIEESIINQKTKETAKTVKYSIFVPMLIKAMQEQQIIINSLEARLDALDGKHTEMPVVLELSGPIPNEPNNDSFTFSHI